MSNPFEKLEQIIARDPGCRGIAPLLQTGDLERACRSLSHASSAWIITGFYIPSVRAPETDGPLGAVALARALQKIGVDCSLVTDPLCAPAVSGFEINAKILDQMPISCPSHLVAIEVLGRTARGTYHNMRGIEQPPTTFPLDQLFLEFRGRCQSIGIGDGGNEVGMGKVAPQVARHIALGELIGSAVATDYLIVAGTSNWGGWGLVAGLSLLCQKNLLPSLDQAKKDLDTMVKNGTVDGVSKRCEATVDGLDWPVHADLLAELHHWLDAACEPIT